MLYRMCEDLVYVALLPPSSFIEGDSGAVEARVQIVPGVAL